MTNMRYIIEALIFTSGDGIVMEDLEFATGMDKEDILVEIKELNKEYVTNNRGIRLIKLEEQFRMCSNPDYYEYLRKLKMAPNRKRLSSVAIETLAIIAYKQPIPKQEIERIRGVKSDYAISSLLEFGLIEEKGRLDAPGRPILFGTTDEFLMSFGYTSLDELPEIEPDKIAELSDEVKRELSFIDDELENNSFDNGEEID